MLNKSELKGKLVSKELSIEKLAQLLGENPATIYRKIARNTFTLKEVEQIADMLHLSKEEAVSIFFA